MSLEKFREELCTHDQLMVQRGEELSLREAEVRKHEEQVDQVEKDKSMLQESL